MHSYFFGGVGHCIAHADDSCTPPPLCPTNTVSNEHYPFEPYFLGT